LNAVSPTTSSILAEHHLDPNFSRAPCPNCGGQRRRAAVFADVLGDRWTAGEASPRRRALGSEIRRSLRVNDGRARFMYQLRATVRRDGLSFHAVGSSIPMTYGSPIGPRVDLVRGAHERRGRPCRQNSKTYPSTHWALPYKGVIRFSKSMCRDHRNWLAARRAGYRSGPTFPLYRCPRLRVLESATFCRFQNSRLVGLNERGPQRAGARDIFSRHIRLLPPARAARHLLAVVQHALHLRPQTDWHPGMYRNLFDRTGFGEFEPVARWCSNALYILLWLPSDYS